MLVATLASGIFYFGASTALGRFYYEKNDILFKKELISSALFISILGAAIMILLGFIFASYLSFILFQTKEYSDLIILTLIGQAAGFLNTLLLLVIRYEKKSFIFLLINISIFFLNLLITYFLLIFYKKQISAPIIGILISNVFFFFVLMYINRNFLVLSVNKILITDLFNFGISAALSSLFYYILDWIDRIYISNYLSVSDVGIYSLGYKIGSIINMVYIIPIFLIWAPLRIQYSKEEYYDLLNTKVANYYTMLGSLFIIGFVVFNNTVEQIFSIDSRFNGALNIYPLIMISALFLGYQNLLDYGIFISKKAYYYIFISIIGIAVNSLLNFYFLPKYGVISSAYITIFTYFLTSTIIYFIAYKYYRFRIEYIKILPVLLLTLFFVSFYKKYFEFYFTSIYLKIIFILILTLSFLFLFSTKEERLILKLKI